jgi:hypothetical protein
MKFKRKLINVDIISLDLCVNSECFDFIQNFIGNTEVMTNQQAQRVTLK